MSLKKVLPFALTGLLTLATACGDDDDSTGPDGDTPTVVEVQNMMVALSSALSAALAGGGPAGIAAQTSIPFELTGACPNGGTSTVTGTFSETSQTTTAYTLTQSFSSCAAVGGGTVYTFNGQGLTTSATTTVSGATFSTDVTQSGTLAWAGGGKSATCGVSWNIDVVVNTSTYASTYDYGGTFCGVSIN